MYAFVRQQLDDSKRRSLSGSDVQPDEARYVSYKCTYRLLLYIT